MAWTLYAVPSARRSDLDTVLRDDTVARQSRKVREASAAGGPSDQVYVLIEGSTEAVHRADELLGPVGTKLPPDRAEPIYRRFREEDESASSGMGLFFTEE
jgi:hypothetical protein